MGNDGRFEMASFWERLIGATKPTPAGRAVGGRAPRESDLIAFRAENRGVAAVVDLVKTVEKPSFLSSQFGRVPAMAPNDAWPTCRTLEGDDEPLVLLCQLNLADAPLAPDVLADLRLIQLFAAPDRLWETPSVENPLPFAMRAYRSLEGLEPRQPPIGGALAKARFGLWRRADDWPSPRDPALKLPRGVAADALIASLETAPFTKIGGFPTLLGRPCWWDAQPDHPARPRFALQIASEEDVDLLWSAGGFLYLARGTAPGYEDAWFVDVQTY